MNIREALKRGCEALKSAGNDNPKPDAQALLLTVLQEERTVLIAHPERELSPEEENTYNEYISERALGKPVSYITGVKEFMGLEFAVSEAVLIPRPETEMLVEEAVRILKSPPQSAARTAPPKGEPGAMRVLDLCTGSGAIAISIKHFVPEAEVTATDLSREALQVARENARRILGKPPQSAAQTAPPEGEPRVFRFPADQGPRKTAVDEPGLLPPPTGEVPPKAAVGGIRFLQGDLFEALGTPELFDIIVSNPPYIPSEVIEGLMPDVKDYEPKMALDGGEDGLDIYRRLIPEAAMHLAPGGTLLLEIGFDQGETVPEICRQAGLTKITVLKDLLGLDRAVRAWYNKE